MSTNVISASNCPSMERRPLVDVLVEKLARRLLQWSERAPREPRRFDERRLAALADERSVATARPVRWY
jgi:hypothetical protein